MKHEIQEHSNGQFTILSFTAFGAQTKYGPYESLEDAKRFLVTYNQVPKDAWKEVEGKANM